MSSIFQSTPRNREFISPTPNEITLMAGLPTQYGFYMDDSYCKELKDCGFNSVGAFLNDIAIEDKNDPYYNKNIITVSLQNCAANNLKAFLFNSKAVKSTQSFVSRFKDKDGFGGWIASSLLSEANNSTNSSVHKEYYDILNAYSVLGGDPAPIFVGINGDWDAFNRTVSNDEIENFYPDYIAEFQRLFEPSFFPLVYFPDIYDKSQSDPTNISKRVEMFYKDLLYFSYITRFTSAPFWATCRCQAYNNVNNFDAPTPRLQNIRGTVFSALAHGAQGIYFQNYRPSSSSYFDTPIDKNDAKTAIWNYVKTVNDEVKAFNDVFCGCEMIDCGHFCPENELTSVKHFTHALGPLMKITTSSSYNLFISHIANKDKNYLVIICDPYVKSTLSAAQYFQYHFNEYWNIFKLQLKANGEYEEVKVSNYEQSYSIFAGNYHIFRWE